MARIMNAYGRGMPEIPVLPPPLRFENPPTPAQDNYDIAQVVFVGDPGDYDFYLYSGAGVWSLFGSSQGDILAVNGTTNQITATTNAGVVTLSLSATLVAPGSVTVTNGFSVLAGTSSLLGTVNINTSGAGVTTIGTGGTGAVNIGNATGNTAVTGALAATTTLEAGTGIESVLGNITATAGQLVAGGDNAGIASTISITNTSSTTIGAGDGSVKMSSANNADNAAWIKIYVGTTPYWIPAWTTNAP